VYAVSSELLETEPQSGQSGTVGTGAEVPAEGTDAGLAGQVLLLRNWGHEGTSAAFNGKATARTSEEKLGGNGDAYAHKSPQVPPNPQLERRDGVAHATGGARRLQGRRALRC
jgi:hypothetical protein